MEPTADAFVALRRLRAEADGPSELVRTHAVTLLVAFGSAVSAESPADLDLAVLTARPLDALTFMEDAYAVTGYERIDVLDLRRAGVVARVQAMTTGRVLFEAHEGLANEQLVQALSQYAETQWMRDAELDSLAS